jgi:hypothetical protein
LRAPQFWGPKSIFALVLGEVDAGDSALSSYYGVMPLLLAIIGAWKYWNQRLTRYFVLLAALSFIYTWGGFSLLHGVLYLAPFLDIARESDRFIYLTQFSMAILAGFGSQALFEDRTPGQSLSLKPLLTILKWVLAIFAIFLAGISLGVKLPASDLTYLSFFFLLASFVLLLIASRQTVSPAVPFIALFLIAWDLYAYAPQDSKLSMAEGNRDLPGPTALRPETRRLSEIRAGHAPCALRCDGIPEPWARIWHPADVVHERHHADRLRALLRPSRSETSSSTSATPSHARTNPGRPRRFTLTIAWNVYENPDVLGRAWIVHQVEVDASNKRLDDAAFDLSQNATLQESPSFPEHTTKEGKPGEVRWLSYQPNSLEVETTTDSPGMLILSEVFYPGWTCTVDGVPTKIYRADAVLRGVPVGAGTHRVSMRYRPASVMWGAAFLDFVADWNPLLGGNPPLEISGEHSVLTHEIENHGDQMGWLKWFRHVEPETRGKCSVPVGGSHKRGSADRRNDWTTSFTVAGADAADQRISVVVGHADVRRR